MAKAQLSLRRQLTLWLLLPQLVLWLAAAALSYTMALRYTDEVIDRTLAKSSRALARQVKPFGDGFYIDFPRAARDILEQDPNDRFYYQVSSPPESFLLGDPNLPPPPPQTPRRAGNMFFYNGKLGHVDVRVVALYLHAGTPERPEVMLVQIAKSRALNAELAQKILLDMGLPLFVLMGLTSILVWAGISRGLSPLRDLRRTVENRSARDLAPIAVDNAPAEVRALTRAINDLLDEVNRQVLQQRRFIADAAHQLRTPLAGLKSQAELLQAELAEPLPDHDSLGKQLGQLQSGVARAIRLVNQLLALARAEPEAGLQMRELDLVALARDVTGELVQAALRKNQDLGFECVESTLPVRGHAGLLRELMANLLDNAIQYTPDGSVITLSITRQGDEAMLCVRDNGPGIPQSELPHVFERFYRGSAEGKGKGCGLGLAIVQEIASRHRCQVSLQNLPDGGLSASFSLPLTG